MSEFRRPSPVESGEPTEPTLAREESSEAKLTRRGFLKGALGLGLAAAISPLPDLSPRSAYAEALDGGDPSVDLEPTPPPQLEALKNLKDAEKAFINQDEEAFVQQFDACPNFEFFSRPTPPRNLTFLTTLSDGSKAGIVVGDENDPSIPSQHLGIISPLYDKTLLNGADGSVFRLAGKILEKEDLVVEFKSSDPEYHRKHGKVFAHFGELGIADGNTKNGVVRPATVPLFKYFTGEDKRVDWVGIMGESNMENGSVLFDPANSYNPTKSFPLSEVVQKTIDGRDDSILCVEINAPVGIPESSLQQLASMENGPPMDIFDQERAAKQMRILTRLYRNALQKLPLALVAENVGLSAYKQLDGLNYEKVELNEIFHGDYEQESYEQILKRIPTLDEILNKPSVTAEDIINIPPVVRSNLIRYK